MSFKDEPWSHRVGKMGDAAERKFEEVYDKGFVRYGLDRPPLRVSDLSVRTRHTPDYLTSEGFVECQGVGEDQVIKVKWEKLNCLLWWNELEPVRLFFWDSRKKRHCMVSLKTVTRLIDSGHASLGYFPEPKAYFALDADAVFEEAE